MRRGDCMETERQPIKIIWYRSPVSREQLQILNQRSDFKGFLQTGGYLGLLAVTGSSACIAAGRLPWPVVVLMFFFHGMCWAFLINGFHEFVHNSVFKTKFLNTFFARVFAFLGWYNPYEFWASHTKHHQYTLHPPDDLEEILPIKLTVRGFLESGFINPLGLWQTLARTVKLACGRLQGPWEKDLYVEGVIKVPEKDRVTNFPLILLFPESAIEVRRQLFNWARILLVGQGAIILVAVVMRWWWLPVVITLAPFYGGWLHYLCNNSQHIGLQDNVPDFRLCCRTITLNPFLGFLYWHMNYHTEHHMYAAVPCYRLSELHALIEADLPACPRGLFETWKQIGMILNRQKQDPMYQFSPVLPLSTNHREV